MTERSNLVELGLELKTLAPYLTLDIDETTETITFHSTEPIRLAGTANARDGMVRLTRMGAGTYYVGKEMSVATFKSLLALFTRA